MSVKTYTYHGPTTSVTLADGTEHNLFDGKACSLPEDNPFVASLVRQRRLKEAPAAPQAEPKPPRKKAPKKARPAQLLADAQTPEPQTETQEAQ
ncbi:MAG: hypothetical protein IGS03_16785 [Candidatus Sericytochromatia bacterium]|nr:hypothetical protein [Candidatus Sericytochromatia bacterium]